MDNMFRQAYELSKKPCGELTDDEAKLLATATAFVANELPKAYPQEMTISEGLLLLAEIAEVADCEADGCFEENML